MTNNSRKRLIWEEIMRDPDIYRVCEAGSSSNSYVFFSGEDVAMYFFPGRMLPSSTPLQRT